MSTSTATPPKSNSPNVTKKSGKKGLLSRLKGSSQNDDSSDSKKSSETTGSTVNTYKNLKPSKRTVPATKVHVY